MRSGKYRHLISIQQPALAADGVGEMLPAWSTLYASLYAEVEPLSGKEAIAKDQINSNVTHRVRTRYVPGVLPAMRVLYGARTLQIQHVMNVSERDRELELSCVEGE